MAAGLFGCVAGGVCGVVGFGGTTLMDNHYRLAMRTDIPIEYRRRDEAGQFAHQIYPLISDGQLYTVRVVRAIEGIPSNISSPFFDPEKEVVDFLVDRVEIKPTLLEFPEYRELFTAQRKTFFERLKYLFNPKSF